LGHGANVKELEDRVALITGASRGLGRAIALQLVSQGARVALNYVSRDDAAQSLANEITSRDGEALLVKADIAQADAVKAMISQILKRWGKIDILVNNAGITRDSLLPRMGDDTWDDVINTNLRGAYLCTKFALRSMMNQSWGRIINVSSLAGEIGNAGQANYSAAKGGLNALTRSVAREVGACNITVNAVAPGFIITDMTDRLPQAARESILARIPLRRFGRPEDVAELVGFLASEQASYITAQIIDIDGGVK
jgi:3-oxoacyl-[acyl-carrier protein] reductase